MRLDVEELGSKESKTWMVPVQRAELERLSPGTLAFLEFRSPRDREVLLKMYEGRQLLAASGPDTWGAKFCTEFHMTNDRGLWTDRDGKLFNPRRVLGRVAGTIDASPYFDSKAWPEIRERMAEKGFWPLYEGKHVEQFLTNLRPVERWVNLEFHQKEHGSLPDPAPKLVFRDIASNTNERTCIAAVLPEKSCANNKLPIIKLEDVTVELAAQVLNSFAFDFAIRFRVSSTLNFTHIGRVAIPSNNLLGAIRPFRMDTNGLVNIADKRENWLPLWSFNRAVAEAYNLEPNDFEHILASFPVFAGKRIEFHAYILERLAEWKSERPARSTRKRAGVA